MAGGPFLQQPHSVLGKPQRRVAKWLRRAARALDPDREGGKTSPRAGAEAARSARELAHFADAMLQRRPYFGPVLGALQGSARRHGYFLPALERLAELKSGPLAILEIGSWAGASAITWAEALAAIGREGRVTCIDTWTPYFDPAVDRDPVYATMNDAAASGAIFQLFLHNVAAAGHADTIDHRRMPSSELASAFAPQSFDLVYVDGDHRYAAVASDLAAAKALLRAPAVLCGDDFELPLAAVDGPAHRTALAGNVDFTPSPEGGASYHPGVTQAVGEAFGEVGAWDGFWGVETDGGAWRPLALDPARASLPRHIREALDRMARG
ncbi:MAG: hypothetical protein DCC71_05325 [Proteobacteria bacterium]|nr:MAG: hypothetical protein DCC71_05325 [Pseudomonadota bacterium]